MSMELVTMLPSTERELRGKILNLLSKQNTPDGITIGQIRHRLRKWLQSNHLYMHDSSLHFVLNKLIASRHIKVVIRDRYPYYVICESTFEPGNPKVEDSTNLQAQLVESGHATASEIKSNKGFAPSHMVELAKQLGQQRALLGYYSADGKPLVTKAEIDAARAEFGDHKATLKEQLAKASEEHRKPVDLSAGEDPEKDFG